MKIHCYAKQSEDLSTFDNVISILKDKENELYFTMENRRSFQEFDKLQLDDEDVVFVISSLNSLGLNDAEITNRLSLFINNATRLVIIEIPSTYEFGVSQPMNQAILSTLLQSVLSGNKNVVTISFKKSNSGRSKIPFPDNWEELYNKWENHKISSKEFIELSGVKKATFYNLMTDYKELQQQNKTFLQKYRIG